MMMIQGPRTACGKDTRVYLLRIYLYFPTFKTNDGSYPAGPVGALARPDCGKSRDNHRDRINERPGVELMGALTQDPEWFEQGPIGGR